MIAAGLALASAVHARPGKALLAIGAVAALCGLAWGWGYAVGHSHVATAVAEVREQLADDKVQAAKDAQTEFQARVREGEQASKNLRDELQARDALISTLKRSSAHVPQLVATEACPRPGDVRLSVGAVRLYDAALGGEDQQLPTSACGAAGDASGAGAAAESGAACEQPSAVTAERFQDVAQANAELHGSCMVRLRRLVKFLEGRNQVGAASGVSTAAGGSVNNE